MAAVRIPSRVPSKLMSKTGRFQAYSASMSYRRARACRHEAGAAADFVGLDAVCPEDVADGLGVFEAEVTEGGKGVFGRRRRSWGRIGRSFDRLRMAQPVTEAWVEAYKGMLRAFQKEKVDGAEQHVRVRLAGLGIGRQGQQIRVLGDAECQALVEG